MLLEADAQAEFHVPRSVGLGGDAAKLRWIGQAQGRVAHHVVVQDVGELENQRCTNALANDAEVLGD